MREIKLRAWNKKKKKMYGKVLEISWGWFYVIVVSDKDDYDTNLPSESLTYNKEMKLEDVELLQFTGLLDSKGKEIYHYDHLKLPNGAIIEIEWYGDKWDYSFIKGSVLKQPRLLDLVNNSEIVGNKYEKKTN